MSSSGFGAWAASIQGTAAIAGCMLVFGVIAGWLGATRPRGLSRRERRELADQAAERAAGQFRAWGSRGGTVMPHKPPSDVGEATDSRAQAGAATGPQRSTDRSLRVGNPLALAHPAYRQRLTRPELERAVIVMEHAGQLEVAHEWEPVHVGQALAVANETGQECADGREDDARDHRGPGWPVNGASSDPITTGEIRAITEGMDVFMARLLGEHPVPYPDGSGQ